MNTTQVLWNEKPKTRILPYLSAEMVLNRSNRSGENEKQKCVFVFHFCTSSIQTVSKILPKTFLFSKLRTHSKQGVMLSFDEEGPIKFDRKKRVFRYIFKAACYPSSFLFSQLLILRSCHVARCQSVRPKTKTETPRFRWKWLLRNAFLFVMIFFFPFGPRTRCQKQKCVLFFRFRRTDWTDLNDFHREITTE